MENNLYTSVAKTAVAEICEKKSRFICNICHAESEEESLLFIEKIRKEHYNAKHNVFAYILRNGNKKYTDDGEPSKTAGLPILEMLEKKHITDVACVVTRYFGGILLGTGGLVRAYTDAAKEGLAAAGTVTMNLCDVIELSLPYSLLGSTEHMLQKFNVLYEDKVYLENISLTIAVKAEISSSVINAVTETFGPAVVINRKGQVYREI